MQGFWNATGEIWKQWDATQTFKNGLYSAAVMAPYGLVGGIGRAFSESMREKQAAGWAARMTEIRQMLDKLIPASGPWDMTTSLLRNVMGMDQTVYVSGEALYNLYWQGKDISAKLDISYDELEQANAAGHDFAFNLASLHTRLKLEEAREVFENTREELDAPTAAEGVNLEHRMTENAERIQQLYQNDLQLAEEMTAEKDRLRLELEQQINANPNLKAGYQSTGGVRAAIDSWINMVEMYALRMDAQNPAEVLRKFTFDQKYAEQREALAKTQNPQPDTGGAQASQEAKEASPQAAGNDSPAQDSPQAAQMPETENGADNSVSNANEDKTPIAWYLMMDENYLSQNALDDLEMTKLAADTAWLSKNENELPVLTTSMRFEDFREGLARWRNKYPDSPGLKEIEDHINWIEGENTKRGYDELYQDEDAVIEIDGNALGVPDGASLKEYIRAAREIYRRFQNNPAHRQDLGDIIFTGAGFKEMAHTGRDVRKWQLVPALREIIEKAEYVKSEELNKNRSDDIIRFHWLECNVKLNGDNLRVGVHIAEDSKGKKFYNLNQDLTGWQENENKKALAGHHQIKGGPQTALFQDANTSSDRNIGMADDNVNLQILEQDENGNPRGSTQIYSNTYLISLFENANLSTLMHETGHVFYEEMQKMADNDLADQSMLDDLQTLRAWLKAEDGAKLNVEQREQIARGFEAYVMEGIAPSKGLAAAFRRFKKWLTRVYQSALQLRAPITDEVRAVFGRMIAADREVENAANEMSLFALMGREIDQLNLTDAEKQALQAMPQKAREEAAERLLQQRNADRKERLRRYRKEAWDEASAEPIYKTRDQLRKTPLDLALLAQEFGPDTISALKRKLPGIVQKDTGIDPEIFAAEQGYNSADELVAAILKSQSKKDRIAEIVAEKERQSDQNFDAAQALLESESLASQLDLVGRKLADLLNEDQSSKEDFQMAAGAMLMAMKAGTAMNPNYFMAAMKRSMQDFRSALYAGDKKRALDTSRKAFFNYECARQSRQLVKERDHMVNSVKRFLKSKSVTPDSKFVLLSMAEKHGIAPMSSVIARGRDSETIRDWLENARANGFDLFIDENAAFADDTKWRDMTGARFSDLADAMAQIIAVERNQRTILTARGRQELDEIAGEMAQTIHAHHKTRKMSTVQEPGKAKSLLENLHASHMKIEQLCLAMDGEKAGPVWEHIYKPINDAENAQAKRFKEVKKDLTDLLAPYFRANRKRFRQKREYVPEIDDSLTFEQRLAIALNMGNETNRARLRDGHNWTDEQIAACVRPLTAADWQKVQEIWDYIGTFKEESFQLQQDVTGLRPKEVEPLSFTAQTADGQIVNLKGGYYPIAYNANLDYKAFCLEQKQIDEQIFGRNYGAAQTQQGHLRERGPKGLGGPLRLDLTVATNHVFNVVHDLAYRRAVIDVAKIIRNPAFKNAVESTWGREIYKQFDPWLKDCANERNEPMHIIHKGARWARASTTMMQMGFKATTMAMQPLGITQTMAELGYGWTMRGLWQTYKNPFALLRIYHDTCEKSQFMANRLSSFDREIRDITKNLSPSAGHSEILQWLREKAFVPMGMFQMAVDLPTWAGAYERGLKENNGDEQKAIDYADSIVRQSQGSGTTKDLSRVQRGSDVMKLFTMFYSYFSTFYNLGAKHIRELRNAPTPAGLLRAANAAMLLWIVPVILAEYAAGRGPKDDDEWWKWAAKLEAAYPFQAIVGVRDVANALFGDYNYKGSPAESAPVAIVKAVKTAWDYATVGNSDLEKVTKTGLEGIGYALNLPLKQAIITAWNIMDYATGRVSDFKPRDLIFAKEKERQPRGK